MACFLEVSHTFFLRDLDKATQLALCWRLGARLFDFGIEHLARLCAPTPTSQLKLLFLVSYFKELTYRQRKRMNIGCRRHCLPSEQVSLVCYHHM